MKISPQTLSVEQRVPLGLSETDQGERSNPSGAQDLTGTRRRGMKRPASPYEAESPPDTTEDENHHREDIDDGLLPGQRQAANVREKKRMLR